MDKLAPGRQRARHAALRGRGEVLLGAAGARRGPADAGARTCTPSATAPASRAAWSRPRRPASSPRAASERRGAQGQTRTAVRRPARDAQIPDAAIPPVHQRGGKTSVIGRPSTSSDGGALLRLPLARTRSGQRRRVAGEPLEAGGEALVQPDEPVAQHQLVRQVDDLRLAGVGGSPPRSMCLRTTAAHARVARAPPGPRRPPPRAAAHREPRRAAAPHAMTSGTHRCWPRSLGRRRAPAATAATAREWARMSRRTRRAPAGARGSAPRPGAPRPRASSRHAVEVVGRVGVEEHARVVDLDQRATTRRAACEQLAQPAGGIVREDLCAERGGRSAADGPARFAAGRAHDRRGPSPRAPAGPPSPAAPAGSRRAAGRTRATSASSAATPARTDENMPSSYRGFATDARAETRGRAPHVVAAVTGHDDDVVDAQRGEGRRRPTRAGCARRPRAAA